ncbi:MAG: glycosyltransferase [Nanoarchaeota archaeon]|nr:glycosyltransferase [Nanoarchaeota archaeon]
MKKKNLLVTLANENYIDQAKQLFSSVYWNAGWKGDYMLLAHEIPEKKLKWFKNKGILVKKCKPIFKNIPTNSVKLSKFYLFTPEFREWKIIVYLDADIIVKASLDDLTKVNGFAAVIDDLIVNRLIDQFITPSQMGKKAFNKFKKNYNINASAFNSGVMTFNTKIIKNTFSRLKELNKKYFQSIKPGVFDQPIFNLFFYKKWKELPIVYNLDARDFNFININKINAIVLHFPGNYKPWFLKNPFYNEWKSNLKRAEKIDLKNVLSTYKFKQSKIRSSSKYLKIKFFLNFHNWKSFINYQIGLIGIVLYNNLPKLYFDLKNLKDKLRK